MHTYMDNAFSTKCQGNSVGERTVFSINGTEITGCLQWMKSDYNLILSMEINSKWIKDLNERANTIKLLEENIGINLQDPGLQNGFLDSTGRKNR